MSHFRAFNNVTECDIQETLRTELRPLTYNQGYGNCVKADAKFCRTAETVQVVFLRTAGAGMRFCGYISEVLLSRGVHTVDLSQRSQRFAKTSPRCFPACDSSVFFTPETITNWLANVTP